MIFINLDRASSPIHGVPTGSFSRNITPGFTYSSPLPRPAAELIPTTKSASSTRYDFEILSGPNHRSETMIDPDFFSRTRSPLPREVRLLADDLDRRTLAPTVPIEEPSPTNTAWTWPGAGHGSRKSRSFGRLGT